MNEEFLITPSGYILSFPKMSYNKELNGVWFSGKTEHINQIEIGEKNMFKNMFGKIESGMCRLSMDGKIAIKTSNGYKTFDAKEKKLTNCTNFVFDVGTDFFFVVPTNEVKYGDIILVDGLPRCVLEAGENTIKTFSYETSEITEIVPEHHAFLGKDYFYGKIVSMFGTGINKGNNIMKYMMLSSIFSGKSNNLGDIMPMLMLMKGENIFDGLFESEETETKEND